MDYIIMYYIIMYYWPQDQLYYYSQHHTQEGLAHSTMLSIPTIMKSTEVQTLGVMAAVYTHALMHRELMGWAMPVSCACAFSAAIKMANYALAVQCWNRSSFATEHFQRKPHKFFDLRCPLST